MNEPVGAMMPRSTRGWARTELVLRTPPGWKPRALPHDQHREIGEVDDFVGNAPHEQPVPVREAPGAHDDEPRVFLLRHVEDGPGGMGDGGTDNLPAHASPRVLQLADDAVD